MPVYLLKAIVPDSDDVNITDKLAQLFEKMDPDCPERPVFVSRSLKWTMSVDQSNSRGHPTLHQKLGVVFWQGWAFLSFQYSAED